MKVLLWLCLLCHSSAFSQHVIPIEFKLSKQETKRLRSIVDRTYGALKRSAHAVAVSDRSYESPFRLIGGTYASVMVDSCAEDNASCIFFSIVGNATPPAERVLTFVQFTYDPHRNRGTISMFDMVGVGALSYKKDRNLVTQTLNYWLARISEFLIEEPVSTSAAVYYCSGFCMGWYD